MSGLRGVLTADPVRPIARAPSDLRGSRGNRPQGNAQKARGTVRSVEALAEDLAGYIEGRPSRHGGVGGLRARKFARRHWAGVPRRRSSSPPWPSSLGDAAGGAQRSGGRGRAERRFEDVRKLANSYLFEFHDAIRDLPGSTPARALVVRGASSTWTACRKKPRATRPCGASSRRRTAGRRCARQSLHGESRGHGGAAESYRKAIALLEPVAAARATDADRETLANDSRRGRPFPERWPRRGGARDDEEGPGAEGDARVAAAERFREADGPRAGVAVRRVRRQRRGKERRGGGRARAPGRHPRGTAPGATGRSRGPAKPRPEPLPRRRCGVQRAGSAPRSRELSRRRGAPGCARRGGPVERDVPSRPRLFVHGDRQHAGGPGRRDRRPRHAPALAGRLRGDGGGGPHEHRSPPRRRDGPPQLRRGPRQARTLRRGARGISPGAGGLRGRRDRLAVGRMGVRNARDPLPGNGRPRGRKQSDRGVPPLRQGRRHLRADRGGGRFRRREGSSSPMPGSGSRAAGPKPGDPRRRGYDAPRSVRREEHEEDLLRDRARRRGRGSAARAQPLAPAPSRKRSRPSSTSGTRRRRRPTKRSTAPSSRRTRCSSAPTRPGAGRATSSGSGRTCTSRGQGVVLPLHRSVDLVRSDGRWPGSTRPSIRRTSAVPRLGFPGGEPSGRKIAQYNLSIPIPNDLSDDFKKRIKARKAEGREEGD